MLALERIVSVIGPVFLMIAIGYGYGRRNRPDLKSFNHVSLHVLGPLLVFTSLAGEDFQLQGNAAFVAGGHDLRAPAQRLVDFVEGRASSDLPPCSYRPGIRPANLHELLPSAIAERKPLDDSPTIGTSLRCAAR